MAQAAGTQSAGSTIEGQWIRLAPIGAYPEAAIHDLMFRLGLRAEMVAPGLGGMPAGSRFGEPAIIAARDTGEMLGVISNIELADYPGVAGLVIYVDEQTRPGRAMEAWWRYVARMFALGATKVQMEVMSFNTPVHRIMRKIGARPEVVLREHFFIAGHHWDGTLYGLDREAWQLVDHRYRDVVARPKAVGRTRADLDTVPALREENSMKVDYLILADAAIAADGKHYLHGAGWETILATAFPVFHPQISAAFRLRIPPGDTGHRLGLDVVGPDEATILAAPIHTDVGVRPGASPPAEEQLLCLTFNVGALHFANPGAYAVVITVDGAESHRTPFFVREAAAPPGSA